MIACVDTHYWEQGSRTGLVLFENWSDETALQEIVSEKTGKPAEYVPGQFYKRELPCILAAMESIQNDIDIIVIDSYVWLNKQGRKGLGALLFDNFNESIPVVGVAKKSFSGSGGIEVFRGESQNPLIVTSAGIEEVEAAHFIQTMHGPYRIPTLIKRADHLARHGKPE